MKPYILLFIAVLLVGCGQQPKHVAVEKDTNENTTEKVSRIPGSFYGMESSNALAKVVSEIDAIQGAMVITDMNGRIVSLAGQPPKQKNDDYDFWHLVARTLDDDDYEACKYFGLETATGRFLLEHYNVLTSLGPNRVVYTEPTYYEDITIYYPAKNPICRTYVLIERKTSDVLDDNHEHFGKTIIKYLLEPLEQISTESINKHNFDFVPRKLDSVRFSYIESVENYYVTGVVSGVSNGGNYANVELRFRHRITGKEFAVRGGCMNWKNFLDIESIQTEVVWLHYPEIAKDGIITAPHNTPFFFADIDFDGKKELITDNSAFAGTQRYVGRFTTIYKIADGRPQDISIDLRAKPSVLNCMDEYFFSVNPARKELIYWHDGGAINFGWEVHKFENGSYRYDRYVRCFNPRDDSVRVDILTSQHDTLKSFTVDKATFDREMWNY